MQGQVQFRKLERLMTHHFFVVMQISPIFVGGESIVTIKVLFLYIGLDLTLWRNAGDGVPRRAFRAA